MKRLFVLLISIYSLSSSQAQVDLPRPSPKAQITQRIGLTDIEIAYYRPAANNRTIFGALVPFGEVWRTGANDATSISFTTDVKIDGKTVKAGEYAIFTIPNKDNWTIILNTNEGQKGSTNYKQNLDVLRFNVKTEFSTEKTERFTIQVDPVSENTVHTILSWENTKVRFPIEVDFMEAAQKNISNMMRTLNGAWYQLANSADFYLKNNANLEEGLKLADKAISMQDHFYPNWIKAQILAKQGKSKEAAEAAKNAQAAGTRNPSSWYDGNKTEIAAAIANWSKKK